MTVKILSRHFVMKAAAGLLLAGIVGCASDRPKDVPPTAMLKAEGDQRVVYTAPREGTVWVTEPGSNEIVYSGPVHQGDRVVLDPDQGKLIVNDHVVSDKGITRHDHRIFFLEGSPVPSSTLTQDSSIARPQQVSPQAIVKGEGKDRVEFTPSTDGAIWVVDTDTNNVIYAGRLMRGETLVIDPTAKRDQELTVAGHSAMSGDLPHNNRRVFFEQGATAPALMLTGVSGALIPAQIPATADLRADGTGRTDFTADNDGTVWAVDVTTARLIYSGRMAKGDTMSLDPAGGHITMNNRPAFDGNLPANDRYRVFFQKGQ